MRKMIPGWVVKGKTLCVDCIGDERPKVQWTLISSDQCQGKSHGKKSMPSKRRTG